MPSRQPADQSFESRVAASFLDDITKVAQRIAADSGDPPGSSRVGDTEGVRLWGQTDPMVDHDALLAALQSTGVPPDIMQHLAIGKVRPEWASLYAQPTPDPEMAQQLAALALYPFRPALVLDYSAEPAEQVARANHLQRLWEQHTARQDAELDGPTPYGAQASPVPPALPQMEPGPVLESAAAPAPPAPSPGGGVPPGMGQPTAASPDQQRRVNPYGGA